MYKSIVHSFATPFHYYMLANDLTGIDGIARFMGSIGLGQRTGSRPWQRGRLRRIERRSSLSGMEAAACAPSSRSGMPETISIELARGYNAYTPSTGSRPPPPWPITA